MKERLDIILTQRGHFPSREKAKAAVMAGIVSVDGIRVDKPGTRFDPDIQIGISDDSCPYVSRGGLKLAKAIEVFGIDLKGINAVDIGASTGGFTDCMLQNGAEHVWCIDVGYGQLDWKLRNDPRVTNMEKTNIRYLDPETIDADIGFVSIDVSFISLALVLPVASEILSDNGSLVCLVKPQFEAGREQVGRKGIVRDPEVQTEVIGKVVSCGEENGLFACGLDYSPVTGAKGNIEYILFMRKKLCDNNLDVRGVVDASHRELDR